jgi:hypothetical protein
LSSKNFLRQRYRDTVERCFDIRLVLNRNKHSRRWARALSLYEGNKDTLYRIQRAQSISTTELRLERLSWFLNQAGLFLIAYLGAQADFALWPVLNSSS